MVTTLRCLQMPELLHVFDQWRVRIKTPHLNDWLRAFTRLHGNPSRKRTTYRVKYITQVWSAVCLCVCVRAKLASSVTVRDKCDCVCAIVSTFCMDLVTWSPTQVKSRPPAFTVFANRANMPENYMRVREFALIVSCCCTYLSTSTTLFSLIT